MTYDEVRQIILDSDQTDWHREQVGFGPHSVATYRRDVNLRFEMPMSSEEGGLHCDKFEEEWATKHPDSRARSYFCSLFYGSSLLKQFILVAVDGGRALLPMPITPKSREVALLEHKVALLHEDRPGSLNEYMERSGLTVVH